MLRRGKAMRQLVFATILMFVLAGGPASAQNAILGQWTGIGLQTNPSETWTISLTFRADGSGTINYPSLECGGELRREGARDGVVFYRERITRGQGRCVDNGVVGVFPHADRLMWFWTGEDTEYSDMAASAVLERAPPIS
jgi:hypothetical protein